MAADGNFQLRVFSGRGLEIDALVSSVTMPTEVGEVGVLADHCDYVGLLSTGLVLYESGAALKRCLVSGGIATFSNNTLTVLADTVDNPEALDLSPLAEDLTLLKTELENLSLFEPEWEVLSQKIARIEALKVLANEARV